MTPPVIPLNDSLFENSKLNKLESECSDSDCSNSEEAFVSEKTEKIKGKVQSKKRKKMKISGGGEGEFSTEMRAISTVFKKCGKYSVMF